MNVKHVQTIKTFSHGEMVDRYHFNNLGAFIVAVQNLKLKEGYVSESDESYFIAYCDKKYNQYLIFDVTFYSQIHEFPFISNDLKNKSYTRQNVPLYFLNEILNPAAIKYMKMKAFW